MEVLEGKAAVVTGAGSGIGRAIALALADAGTHVVVADIQSAAAEAVRDEVRSRGVRALAVTVDVARLESVTALADAAYAEFGAVDILCNNAGVSWRPFRSILEASMADWEFILGVNVWGVVHGLHTFLPRMRQQPGEKHVVNTSSVAGLLPLPGHIPYSASKAAVNFITEAAAQELAPFGFGFTTLCPGIVHTNIKENSTALRADEPNAAGRIFAPRESPLAKYGLPSFAPEEVGRMAVHAIRTRQLYVNTSILPAHVVDSRADTMFGAATLGQDAA